MFVFLRLYKVFRQSSIYVSHYYLYYFPSSECFSLIKSKDRQPEGEWGLGAEPLCLILPSFHCRSDSGPAPTPVAPNPEQARPPHFLGT